MTKNEELIAPREDDIYRPHVEELLGITLDNITFEKIAWYIVDYWLDHVMEGSPEDREELTQLKTEHAQYVAYLLRNDLDRAKSGSPYPLPTTERMKRVWNMAKKLYFMDDPSGFLGPSVSEMVYVGRAIVLAAEFGSNDFEPELLEKIETSSIWPWYEVKDKDFHQWVHDGGLYAMFEHRGSDYVDDKFLAQPDV